MSLPWCELVCHKKVFSILVVYIFYRWQCSVSGIQKPQNLILLTVSGWGKLWKHAQTSALKICGLLHNPQPKTMWCLINPSNLLLHSPGPTQSSGRRFQIFCPNFDSVNLGDNVENVPSIYYIYIIYRNKVRAEVATTKCMTVYSNWTDDSQFNGAFRKKNN